MICQSRKKLGKNAVFFFVLSMFFVAIWILLSSQEDFENCWAEVSVNCGDADTHEVLLLPREDTPSPASITFLEGHFHDHLSPRMLCAIESAAATNTEVPVNVLMTSESLKLTPITRKVMQRYENVRFLHLNATKLFQDSPVKEWFLQEKWRASSWPKSHFNDALRWLVLWKFGGVYLDLDVVVMRNLFATTENFVVMESDKWVGAGALKFSPGHHFVSECLSKLTSDFDGSVWGANGPELLTRTLISWCGMELPSGTLKFCSDIHVFQPQAFYPIPWWKWYLYLQPNNQLSNELLQDPVVLGIHVWNLHTHAYPVLLRESNPYAVAANKFCPVSVNEVGAQF